MLISTVRGFFRRIFRVDQLVEELVDQQKFYSRPEMIASTELLFLSPGTDSKTIPIPEGFDDTFGVSYVVLPMFQSELGNANHAWIDYDESPILRIDQTLEPGDPIKFVALFIRVGNP